MFQITKHNGIYIGPESDWILLGEQYDAGSTIELGTGDLLHVVTDEYYMELLGVEYE
jgi:hypothetical protein